MRRLHERCKKGVRESASMNRQEHSAHFGNLQARSGGMSLRISHANETRSAYPSGKRSYRFVSRVTRGAGLSRLLSAEKTVRRTHKGQYEDCKKSRRRNRRGGSGERIHCRWTSFTFHVAKGNLIFPPTTRRSTSFMGAVVPRQTASNV